MENQKKTLLIAEDNVGIQAIYKKVFGREGFNVVLCDNAAQAMAELNEQKVDLLMTDLEMPLANTFELFPYLKEKFPRLPVIIVTGHYRNLQDEFAAKGFRMSAFFNKPVGVYTLLDKVREVLKIEKPAPMSSHQGEA
jgi:two-component system response regulator GlrR